MSYSDETSAALTGLIASQPFFATFLMMRMHIIEDDSTPTAKTDGTNIWVGPWFRKKLSPQQRVFVLCHEILHGIMMHCQRARRFKDVGTGPDGKPIDFKRWNQATDYIINDTLVTSKVGAVVPDMLFDRSIGTYQDLADDVYRRIPEDPQGQGGQKQQGDQPGQGGGKPCKGGKPSPGKGDKPGKGEGDQQGHGNFDEHELAPGAFDEADEAAVKRAVVAAANAARSRGDIPGALREFIDNLLNGKLSWQDMLRRRLTATSRSGDNDWSRPNRRKLAFSAVTGIDLPVYASHKDDHCGIIVVQIDTSGSIRAPEVCEFLAEVRLIVEDCRPSELYILWTDAKIAHVDHVGEGEDMSSLLTDIITRLGRDGVPGGGGTDMRKGFDYVDKWGIDADTMVTFTDGYTPWPAEKPAWYHLAIVTEKDKLGQAKKVGDAVWLG